MPCPRCGRDTQPALATCTGCGAPLSLGDEPAARPLEVSLALDRRMPDRDRLSPPARETERSHWDLGVPPAPAPAPSAHAPLPRLELPEPEPDPAVAPAVAREVAPAEVHLRRAPAGRRVLAWIIDVVPFAAAVGALARAILRDAPGAPPAGPDGLLDLLAREAGIVLPLAALLVVALFVYATLAHALAGATLGKWALGLRVAGPDGRRPSLGRSAARSALAVLSAAVLGLGFLAALFTRSGRSLHDLLARTWVVEA